jgi:hypothetical protein
MFHGAGGRDADAHAGGDHAKDGVPGLSFLMNLRDETVLIASLHDLVPQGRRLGAREEKEWLGGQFGEGSLAKAILSASPAQETMG